MADEFDDLNSSEDMNPFERFFFIMQLRELKQILESIKKDVEANHDDREKKVGDRVKLWDFSANRVKEDGRKINYSESYFKENEAIVVDEGLDIKFVYNPQEDFNLSEAQKEILKDIRPPVIIMDILLRYPDGTELYTCSSFIKRTDAYEK